MSTRKPVGKRASKSRHVPGQLFGYSLQAIRFLRVLLEAPPGSIVTLEVFEDVGLEAPNGKRVASQVKSGLTTNPLSDKAIDLWKTLANWCDAIDGGELDPQNTVFEIYVGKPRKGKLASLLNAARTREEAQRTIDAIKKVFLRPVSRTAGAPSDAASYATRVLKLEQNALTSLIQNFRITPTVRDPLADLRPVVATKWVRPESLEIVIQHAHGWVKERLDGLLLLCRPAAIRSDEFQSEMLAFLPRCDFRTIITDMAGLPSPEQIEAEKMSTYVRQLGIIEVDDETTLQAINEFLRASVTRTKLSEAGIVHNDSFAEYEEALTSFWRNKRRQNRLINPQRPPEELGQLLLSDCCLHQQRLQGLDLPPYFTPGSYHALADVETVGWHPDYSTRLKDGKG